MRKSAEKIVWIPVAAVLFLLVLIGGVLAVVFHRQSGKHVLHFGMIAGSCWDVPTGNCYEVVDAAIARFGYACLFGGVKGSGSTDEKGF